MKKSLRTTLVRLGGLYKGSGWKFYDKVSRPVCKETSIKKQVGKFSIKTTNLCCGKTFVGNDGLDGFEYGVKCLEVCCKLNNECIKLEKGWLMTCL